MFFFWNFFDKFIKLESKNYHRNAKIKNMKKFDFSQKLDFLKGFFAT